MKRKERGVTLIALVVTIVVLLILASIGIGAITSDTVSYTHLTLPTICSV